MDITVIVGMACTVIGGIIGVWKVKKDADKDTREDATRDTTVSVKLEYISKGIDDIRIDNKVRDKQMMEFTERLVAVEKSAASAHHRLDTIEENYERR